MTERTTPVDAFAQQLDDIVRPAIEAMQHAESDISALADRLFRQADQLDQQLRGDEADHARGLSYTVCKIHASVSGIPERVRGDVTKALDEAREWVEQGGDLSPYGSAFSDEKHQCQQEQRKAATAGVGTVPASQIKY